MKAKEKSCEFSQDFFGEFMKFGERLSEELKASGITQKELAQKVNVDPSNITNWKKGLNFPSLEMFYQLCRVLDVSADYLLGLVD